MKISELRTKLAVIEAEHGDLECLIGMKACDDSFSYVRIVEYDGEHCLILDY